MSNGESPDGGAHDSGAPGETHLCAFHFTPNPDESIREQEARFWDEHEKSRPAMIAKPHDWAFDIELGNAIQAPTYHFLESVIKRLRPGTILDIGCGTGVYSRSLARHGRIRGLGIDLSQAQVDRASQLAREAGVSDLIKYHVADALEYTAPEKVDAICAFGVLHHLPDVETLLPGIIERNLKPGGVLIAVEPFHEGFPPSVLRFMSWIANSRLRRWFDIERYEAIAAAAERGETILGESPSGLLHEHKPGALDAYLRSAFDPVCIRYTRVYAPFFANAFVIYQKSTRVARLARMMVPSVVRLDSMLCRFPRWSRYATLGLYAVRRKD